MMSCASLPIDLGAESVWEKAYTNLIEPRGGASMWASMWTSCTGTKVAGSSARSTSKLPSRTRACRMCRQEAREGAADVWGSQFENTRVPTTLTARAEAPAVDPAECPWRSSALIFEWSLSRQRFNEWHHEFMTYGSTGIARGW